MAWKVPLQVAALFILPVVLLLSGAVSMGSRFLLLGMTTTGVAGVIFLERRTMHELGIRRDNLPEAFVPYALFTAMGIAFIGLFSWFLGAKPSAYAWTDASFVLSVLPLSLVQEFLFRSFLLPTLKRVSLSTTLAITLNGLLFAFMHLIYPHALALFPLGLLGGLGFAYMYHRYPNLPLISLSHSVLNFAAVVVFLFFTVG
jgi:membrane protease YdiL (CAAX protease family)